MCGWRIAAWKKRCSMPSKLSLKTSSRAVSCGARDLRIGHNCSRIARRWPLIGNAPETVAAIKDPIAFARLCGGCGIPHPETSRSRPADVAGWLIKRPGGAGGSHIRSGGGRHDLNAEVYFQRRVGGVRPTGLAPQVEDALARAVQTIVAAAPLVGLNSADFLVREGAFHLLEINPRPGATLDMFEPAYG